MADERKEKVIHTRIPAALEEQIKRLAEGLRVPVSNLVRNALEDAIDMTRRMRDRVPDFVGMPPEGASAKSDLSNVYGWQELTLNVEAPCARCQTTLAPGDAAYLGLTDRPRDRRVFICPACLPRRSGEARPPPAREGRPAIVAPGEGTESPCWNGNGKTKE